MKRKLLFVLFIVGFSVAAASIKGYCEEGIDTIYVDEIFMQTGELETLKVHSLTQLSLTQPGVADILNADDKEILLIAKTPGETVLFIWDEHGKRTVTIHVLKEDLSMIKKRITDLLQQAKIEGMVLNEQPREQRIVITGRVNKEEQKIIDSILEPFGPSVLKLTEEFEVEDLVQIDIQVTELNETLAKSLGVKWTSNGSDQGIILNYEEDLPSFDGSIGDLFKIGKFSRTNNLLTAVQAIVQEGKGRILSKPRLVVKSGQEANFLVGGEVPIRTSTQTSSGGLQENVSFKEYGISMDITPEITRHDKVNVTLSIEVSDIDAANAVGDDVAFTTRTAETQMLLENTQTIVLAGLIRKQQSQQVTKVPFLGDIPVLGLLFRNKTNPTADQDTELVISMTPTILSDYDELRVSKKDKMKKEVQDSGSLKAQTAASPQTQRKVSTAEVPQEMYPYIREVQQKLSQSITYPDEAQQFGWEGTVKVGLHILKDGTLAFALVKESSGYDLFDENALMIAKSIAPYSKFPTSTELQELNVTIPIVYSLQEN